MWFERTRLGGIGGGRRGTRGGHRRGREGERAPSYFRSMVAASVDRGPPSDPVTTRADEAEETAKDEIVNLKQEAAAAGRSARSRKLGMGASSPPRATHSRARDRLDRTAR